MYDDVFILPSSALGTSATSYYETSRGILTMNELLDLRRVDGGL